MKSIEIGRRRIAVVAFSLALMASAYAGAQGSTAEEEERGSTVERSSRAGEAKAAIARRTLAVKLEDELGGAYGGVWFEPSTAQLHVGVTSPASRHNAEAISQRAGLAAVVVETPVRSSWKELIAAQKRLNRDFADLFERAEIATSLEPERNAVDVVLGSQVPAQRRAALEQEAVAAGVDVSVETSPFPYHRAIPQARCGAFEIGEANCDPSIVAGTSFIPGDAEKGNCTTGPAVVLDDQSLPETATETFVLTAGHCVANSGGVGAGWYARDKAGNIEVVGQAVQYINSNVDVGVVKVENVWALEGSIPVKPAVAVWSNKEHEPTPVTIALPPVKDEKSCISGQVSGVTCGTVKNVSLTLEKNENLAEVEIEGGKSTTAKGDSGAPWYLQGAPGWVEGTHKGKRESTEDPVFQELHASLTALKNYEILLTSSQVRHPFRMVSEGAPTVLTGKQHGAANDVFTVDAGKLVCNEATYSGEATETEVGEVSVTPAYSGCTVFGLFAATVHVNGCKYTFTPLAKTPEEAFETTADIVCPVGKKIEVTAPGCRITVGPQTGISAVTLTNAGAGTTREVTVDVGFTEFAYEEHNLAPTPTCASNTVPKPNGEYEGAASLTGEAPGGAHRGIWLE